ncbi:AraC family transcriptional regulator [Paenibacillus aurantiacus]|uniref:AraC family transcriptional regulator n=1 Tax=Paenibacillus aurantiacus TaxID=1936118 RepID=A0ABV5KT74_9BACL
MTTFMDYTISKLPIRIVDRMIDPGTLSVKSLSLITAGHLPNRTLFRRSASFNHHAIVYIADGSGTYQVNGGERQPVGKGSFFLFYPGAVFDYGPGPNETWDEFYFTVEGSRVEEWFATWLVEPDRVKQAWNLDTQRGKIERIFALMDSGDAGNLDRAALLLETFLFELMQCSKPPGKAPSVSPTAALLEAIQAGIAEPFDAPSLCERHHLSMSTLRRAIHKATGYSLHEYVHRLKISEAKNILLNTNQSVKETALALGFKDVFYFSRLFKKIVGVSPQHYRNHV